MADQDLDAAPLCNVLAVTCDGKRVVHGMQHGSTADESFGVGTAEIMNEKQITLAKFPIYCGRAQSSNTNYKCASHSSKAIVPMYRVV